MTFADLGQSPVARHATVAFLTTDARFAFALFCLRVAGVRNTAQPVAVAQARATCTVGSARGRLTIRTATVPGVRALHRLSLLS